MIRVDSQVYLLADTTFNSLAVDEVAAEHINAECVVHYGYASLSPVSKLPTYFVFPSKAVDTEALTAHILCVNAEACDGPLLVLLDLAYVHARNSVLDALKV